MVLAGQKYVLVSDGKDSKEPAAPLANPRADLSLATSRAAASVVRGQKLKPITVVIPYSVLLSTGGTGLCNITADITPWTNTTEWAAWQTLYSEFKVLRCRFDFGLMGRQTRTGGAFGSQHLFAMGFDPVSAVAPVGTRQITELSQHKLLASRLITAGASSSADVYGFADGLHSFSFSIPKGPAVAAATSIVYAATWLPTAAPIAPGALKVYVQMDDVGTTMGVGIMYCTVEFRSRAM